MLFKKNQAAAAKTQSIPTRPSKKLKNTYIIKQTAFMNPLLFEHCETTPLGVIEKNGEKMPHDNGWGKCEQFVNPGPATMYARYHYYMDIMTDTEKRLASTIVEYLDKETRTPVAYMYPNGDLVTNKYDNLPDLMARLNHATRRDMTQQSKKRTEMWAAIISRQNQK